MLADAVIPSIDPRQLLVRFTDGGRADRSAVPLGVEAVDALLPGGLRTAALHEVHAAAADAAAASGLCLAFARRLAGCRPVVWVRAEFLNVEAGRPYPPGLAEFGLDPGRVTLVVPHDAAGVLAAALEAARCPGLGAAVIELYGTVRGLDLTASRRLVLAAEKSGVALLLARPGGEPAPSAAETRWSVAAAPSRALAAGAPGRPAFALALRRQRSGLPGGPWRVEWNRDLGCFEEGSENVADVRRRSGAPLSGAVVSLSFGRSATPGGGDGGGAPSVRRAG